MPRFLVTVITLILLSGSGLAYVIFYKSPEQTYNLMLFFTLFFVFLLLVTSLPTYWYMYKKAPKLTELRILYRKSLRPAFFIASYVTILGVLRVLHAFNALNLLLLSVLTFTLIKLTKPKE